MKFMKSIVTSGKRKTAVARATLKQGTGRVTVNNISLDVFEPAMARLKLKEPIILAGKDASKVDISVNVHGGGIMSQTDASRLAIGRALSEKYPALKDVFSEYDRQLLVADVRRREVSKPNSQGNPRAKRQKSYR